MRGTISLVRSVTGTVTHLRLSDGNGAPLDVSVTDPAGILHIRSTGARWMPEAAKWWAEVGMNVCSRYLRSQKDTQS